MPLCFREAVIQLFLDHISRRLCPFHDFGAFLLHNLFQRLFVNLLHRCRVNRLTGGFEHHHLLTGCVLGRLLDLLNDCNLLGWWDFGYRRWRYGPYFIICRGKDILDPAFGRVAFLVREHDINFRSAFLPNRGQFFGLIFPVALPETG